MGVCVSSHDKVTNYKSSSQPKGLVCMTMCKYPKKTEKAKPEVLI